MSLLTNLVSYWKLDEASGTRVDSHGTNHLTPTNAPVGATGKIGNGCDFEASSSQYLSCPSNATLQMGDVDFTFAAWVRFESVPSLAAAFAKALEYNLLYRSDFTGWTLGLGNDDALVTKAVVPVVGTWQFVVAWHDTTLNTINVQIDNGTPATAADVTPSISDSEFRLGIREAGGFPFDGLIDEVGFWKRVLTPAERTALYNAGNGLAYPFGLGAYAAKVAADGASNHWPLNEPSGTTAVDVIGGKNGVISGGVLLNQAGIAGSKAMTFNGTTGKIDIPSLTIPAVSTVEAWVKSSSTAQQAYFSNRGAPGGTLYGSAGGAEGKRHFLFIDAVGPRYGDMTFLADGPWHHVVVVFGVSSLTIYRDGVDHTAAAYTDTKSAGSGVAGIGYDPALAGAWTGLIDEVAIYPLALTPAQILAHYQLGAGGGGGGGLLLGVG